MLIYFPETKDYKFYNYREKALINSDTRKSTIGTPGLVKGIEEIQSKHGKLNMSDLIQYSIDLAQNGFKMNENLYYKLSQDSSLEKYSLLGAMHRHRMIDRVIVLKRFPASRTNALIPCATM